MQGVKNLFKNCPEVLNLLLFILGGVILVYLTNHFFWAFSPFIIAYLLTRVLRPLMVRINKKVKLPRTITTLLCLLIFVLVAALIIWFFLYNIVDGVEYVVNLVSTNVSISSIMDFVTIVEEKILSFSDLIPIDFDINTIAEPLYDLIKSFISGLSNVSIQIVAGVPSFLISFIIGSIASFYMLYDYDKIADFIEKQLSPKTKQFIDVFNNNVLLSFFKMIFSYILISAICFVELGIGFWILGIKDAWFIAFIIAIVDVFPIVGSGGILVPWGVIALLLGNPVQGIGLMILWGVIVIVRQIIEPKIVGSQIGLHSLLTIMALYLGLKLMGGLGLIMGPLYIIICKKLNESGVINLYKNERKEEENEVKNI